MKYNYNPIGPKYYFHNFCLITIVLFAQKYNYILFSINFNTIVVKPPWRVHCNLSYLDLCINN